MDIAGINQLIKKRGILKGRLSKLQTYVQQFDESQSIDLIKGRLQTLEAIFSEFNQVQSELEIHDDNVEEQLEYRDSFEDVYWTVVSEMQHLIRQSNENSAQDVANSTEIRVKSCMKLPPINLPSFEGNFTTWIPYYDTFSAMIHNNENLANIQKFHYLISSLKGEALQLVQKFPLSNENYSPAWTALVARYNNVRLIVSKHIQGLLETDKVHKESARELRSLVDLFKGHLNALEAQGIVGNAFKEAMIIQLIVDRLDATSRREWELYTPVKQLPTSEALFTFLDNRCHALEALKFKDDKNIPHNKQSAYKWKHDKSSHSYVTTARTCPRCNQDHALYHCKLFKEDIVQKRHDLVIKYKLCFNCLGIGHNTRQCKLGHCRKCEKKHNTLLHREQSDSYNNLKEDDTKSNTTVNEHTRDNNPLQLTNNYCAYKQDVQTQVLLSTALVHVYDANGQIQLCRILLDSASQSNFISEACVQRLKLKRKNNAIPIIGINNSVAKATHSVTVEIQSRVSEFTSEITCLILPKITNELPNQRISIGTWEIPQQLELADPNFNIPAPIDILIGASIFFDVLLNGRIKARNLPIIQQTTLGWIFSGNYHDKLSLNSTHSVTMFTSNDVNLDNQLQKLWQLEEVKCQTLSPEEQACEEHFKLHTNRDDTGRFIVRLPFHKPTLKLGDSYLRAKQRFQQLERKLTNNPQLKQEYVRFMKEYIELGHMTDISHSDVLHKETQVYYMPHHAVIKETSSTTRTRVVFDASAKTDNNVSLNDVLMVGPTVQPDLYTIITRFRTYPIAFVADIEKMYRQVQIDPRDTSYQRILWREAAQDTLKTYQLNTLTYGTASAPFLATRCLNQLALDESTSYPRAAEIIQQNMYVDDLMSGEQSVQQALKSQTELITLLKKGGFQLRKWASNCPMVMSAIPAELRETTSAISIDNNIVHALGLLWQPSTDSLLFSFKMHQHTTMTKRKVLAITASIFDPLGLIGPVLVACKIFMQRLWQAKINWDDVLPTTLQSDWHDIHHYLPEINDITIPRLIVGIDTLTDIQLHGFSDASQVAYGACIYLRCINISGSTSIKLICSKSKIAPLKQISIPRLELCAAMLLAKLSKKVKNILHMNIHNIHLWTDSTVVLAWIRSPSNRWKTFVANRVAEIHEHSQLTDWKHVSGRDNPADVLSRGTNPHILKHLQVWWQGPDWLMEPLDMWPKETKCHDSEVTISEQCNTVVNLLTTKSSTINYILEKHSSLLKIQRVIAYCFRFINAIRDKDNTDKGVLSYKEIRHGLHICIRLVQAQEFTQELQHLQSPQHTVQSTSKIKDLHPFIDELQCLRVGGRLQASSLPYDQKHPLILPVQNKLTQLIIMNEHLRLHHAGAQLTLTSLRLQYWIPKGRSTVRHVIHKCLRCFKFKTKTSQQLMGQLPSTRIEPARPFLNTGIDYGGPFLIRTGSTRTKLKVKCYVALFICLATKAIHLELVSNLSTDALIAALRRFISRRGICANIYSDNGTNLVGARRELKQLYMLFQTQQHNITMQQYASTTGFTWHFIPPSSPHFGGLWEAGIKSMKYHLKRSIGTACLTFEEMTTLLSQIEACLNSRPILAISNDSDDPPILTPAHFLIGDSLMAIPEPDLTNLKITRLSRWQMIQQIQQNIWHRWSTEYLGQLQQRSKWSSSYSNIQPGDVVLIKEDNLPPLVWKTAVVSEVHPGVDGLVRVASVRTSTGTLLRPVKKLCILPFSDT